MHCHPMFTEMYSPSLFFLPTTLLNISGLLVQQFTANMESKRFVEEEKAFVLDKTCLYNECPLRSSYCIAEAPSQEASRYQGDERCQTSCCPSFASSSYHDVSCANPIIVPVYETPSVSIWVNTHFGGTPLAVGEHVISARSTPLASCCKETRTECNASC
jgi:hypothetical protein